MKTNVVSKDSRYGVSPTSDGRNAPAPGRAVTDNAAADASEGISVLLADDHGIFRQGVRRLLESAVGITVVGEAADGRAALESARQLKPTVVLMDIAMPNLYGIEACRQILAAVPGTKVILLSGYTDDSFITGAELAGAAGYVLKQSSPAVLLGAIREVARGGRFLSPRIAQRLRPADGLAVSKDPRCPAAPSLTTREREVLQLVAEGSPNKEIASILDISVKTVEKHRQSLMNRLNIHDTAGLTRYAIVNRIVETSMTSDVH